MKRQRQSVRAIERVLGLHAAALLSAILLIVMSVNGCKSDSSTINQTNIGSQSTGTSTLYGRIVDEGGQPLAGVQVSAGTASTLTDQRGLYILRDAPVTNNRAVIIARKPGYFDAAKAEATGSNGTTRIEASMMTTTTTATVSAYAGGTVTTAGGAKVVFQAGSFVDASSGAAYTGTVSVAARYLDTKNVSYFDYFSGDNDAQTASGRDVGLITNGVIRVDLRGSAGQKLNLAAAKPATLSFPKSLDPKAPTTMPLWYFDQTLGKWKEDGSAKLTGNNYVGTVTHFTDWNLDYYDTTGTFGANGDVTLRIVCGGIPIEGVVITIVGDDAPGKYFVHPGGRTGPDGVIHFRRFPANRPTQIDVRADRNNGVFFINAPITVNITPGQKLDLGDISLNSTCPAQIKGTLTNCADTNAEGLVIATFGTTSNYTYTKHGPFTVNVPSAIAVSIDAMNANSDQATTVSVPPLASGEIHDIGTVKICGTGVPTFTDLTIPNSSYIVAMKLSPDGSRIAVVFSQPAVLNVYDTKTSAVVSSTTLSQGTYPAALGFSKDNTKLLFSTGMYGQTQIFDVSAPAAVVLTTVTGVYSPLIYDDGTKFIASKNSASPNPPVINIYSTADGSILSTVHPAGTWTNDSMYIFGLIRDENAIVYADPSITGTDRVWSVSADAETRNFSVSANPGSFRASDDGLTVAHSADNITYSFFDSKGGGKLGDVAIPKGSSREYGFEFTKNFVFVADHLANANIVRSIKIVDGTSTIRLLGDSVYVRTISASRDESTLAAATYNSIRIWMLK